MFSFVHVIETLLIATAISTDAFVSGFSYGANKIKIPFASVAVISVTCSLILAASLFFGAVVKPFLPARLTAVVSFGVLFLLGIVKLFDSAIKIHIRKYTQFSKKIKFSIFSLRFILNVYADPEEADMDRSKSLSPLEAAYLAAALSLDGLAVGFGAGLGNVNLLLGVAFSILTNMAGVISGAYLGNKIAQKFSLDLSWASGAILLALAFMRLF